MAESTQHKSKKLFIQTYGCQMNVYDSVRMQQLLNNAGYVTCDSKEDADLILLNTCHIREKASEKVYSELGRIGKIEKSQDRKIKIIVAGCTAQAEGEEIFKRAPGVDAVVGPQSYHNLPSMIAKLESGESKKLLELDFVDEEKFDRLPEESTSQGGSAFLSIQEGCDKFCTFCVVPYTRGAEFSRPVSAILDEAGRLADSGSSEIVLLGQNVNAYHGLGTDGKQWSLARLIDSIARIPSIKRIRYTTSHPSDMDDDLIAIHGSEEKLMPFLHLPVQSGSDAVLRAMNRKHSREFYYEIIDKLLKSRPDIAFSSDFIVGFPGETDKDFEDTMELIRRVGFAQCYSFKYSPRPGTPAISKKQLPDNIKSERLAILQNELSNQQIEFNKKFVGQMSEILITQPGKYKGHLVGKTPYMQSVYIRACDDMIGKIKKVKITDAFQTSLAGELL